MNAAHAEATGKSGYQRSQHRESNQHDDQQREAGEQCRGCSLQDRVDDSDECVEKSHLSGRTLESGCVPAGFNFERLDRLSVRVRRGPAGW